VITAPSRLLPSAALIAASFLWGSSFVALKTAFTAYDPMVVIFGRMTLAAALFLLVPPKIRLPAIQPGDTKHLLLMALCEPCLYFLFEAKALTYTSASQAGVIVALLPLMAALAAWVLLKEPLSRRVLAGFGLAVAGACWLSVGGVAGPHAPHPALGNFLEFLAMGCATGNFIVLKRLTRRYSPWFLTAAQAIVGSLFYFPLLLLPGIGIPSDLPLVPTLAVVYLGAAISIGAYGFYNYGLSRLPVSMASSYLNLIPVFAVMLGWTVLGERFTGSQYLASLLVFAGLYLTQTAGVENRSLLPALPAPAAGAGAAGESSRR
jgi:drug/metabolite transporter (DMT)-like permease